MMRKFRMVLVVAVLLALVAPPAFAVLTQVGPLNPANGYPQWYMDSTGKQCWLPTPPFGNGVTPPTFIFLAPNTAIPFSVQIGFDAEAFYFLCRADKATFASPLGRILAQVGLEAGFANLVTLNGDQAVFSRLRITFPKAPAGTYTFKHPYGTESILVTAADVTAGRGIKFTRDIPAPAPLNFTGALAGDTGPFLKQLLPAPAITLGTPVPFNTQWQTDPAGKGWLGDGVSVATFTGSPVGFNGFQLSGPITTITTSLATISGWDNPAAAATATPLTINQLTYSRPGATTTTAIYATSVTGAVLNAFDPATSLTAVPMTPGTTFTAGKYFAAIPTAGVPALVKVDATAPGFATTSISQAPVDVVTITQAQFSLSLKTLTIAANSSDVVFNPSLTVTTPALGLMTPLGAGKATLTVSSPIPTPTVAVNSAKGGSATAPVALVP